MGGVVDEATCEGEVSSSNPSNAVYDIVPFVQAPQRWETFVRPRSARFYMWKIRDLQLTISYIVPFVQAPSADKLFFTAAKRTI